MIPPSQGDAEDIALTKGFFVKRENFEKIMVKLSAPLLGDDQKKKLLEVCNVQLDQGYPWVGYYVLWLVMDQD